MKLKELKNTVVNTKTRKEFSELMEIYEKAGWRWHSGNKPTKTLSDYTDVKEKTCVEVGNYFFYSDIDCYKRYGYKIISLSKFKQLQGLEEKRKRGRPRKEQVIYVYSFQEAKEALAEKLGIDVNNLLVK